MNLIPHIIGGSVIDSDEFFKKYVLLMSRYTDHVLYVVTKTRDYHHGLHFCDETDRLTDAFQYRLDDEHHRAFRCNTAGFRLKMYDKLDYWDDYVRYFEELFNTTDSHLTYVHRDDYKERFGRFLLRSDGAYDHVHWLYPYNHRYRLICKKLDALRAGKKVGHLRHKPRSELSEEEIQRRFYEGLREVQILMGI